jgi:DNA repair protein RadC
MQYIREIKVRYGRKQKTKSPVRSSLDIVHFINRKILLDNSKEHFMLFCLDGSHNIAAYNVVSIGTATSALVHPREVFQPAILAGAVSIIVAHNHPSGSIEPSQEDFKSTDQLKQASKLLGIRLLDHIIVGEGNSYYSFQEHGKMI